MDHITYGALKGICSTGILLVSTEGERQTTERIEFVVSIMSGRNTQGEEEADIR